MPSTSSLESQFQRGVLVSELKRHDGQGERPGPQEVPCPGYLGREGRSLNGPRRAEESAQGRGEALQGVLSSLFSPLRPPTHNWPFQAVLTYLKWICQVFLPSHCAVFLGWSTARSPCSPPPAPTCLYFQPTSELSRDAPPPPGELRPPFRLVASASFCLQHWHASWYPNTGC